MQKIDLTGKTVLVTGVADFVATKRIIRLQKIAMKY